MVRLSLTPFSAAIRLHRERLMTQVSLIWGGGWRQRTGVPFICLFVLSFCSFFVFFIPSPRSFNTALISSKKLHHMAVNGILTWLHIPQSFASIHFSPLFRTTSDAAVDWVNSTCANWIIFWYESGGNIGPWGRNKDQLTLVDVAAIGARLRLAFASFPAWPCRSQATPLDISLEEY